MGRWCFMYCGLVLWLPALVDGARVRQQAAGNFSLGQFTVAVQTQPYPRLSVRTAQLPGHVLWDTSSVPGGRSRPSDAPFPFLEVVCGQQQAIEQGGGCFWIREHHARAHSCADPILVAATPSGNILTLHGTLCAGTLPFSLDFVAVGAQQLRFTVTLEPGSQCATPRVWLQQALAADEAVYGLGLQYSRSNAVGHRIPIFAREQGVGRGLFPLTELIDAGAPGHCGGDTTTSYTHVPQYVTSQARSLLLETLHYVVVDATEGGRLSLQVNSSQFSGQILAGDSMPALVRLYAQMYAGLMPALPEWLIEGGAILGMEGGEAVVTERLDIFRRAHPDCPILAVWLQVVELDWAGLNRPNWVGEQTLYWNWVYNPSWYPHWPEMVANLTRLGIRTMSYVNMFLANVSALLEPTEPNYFIEAAAQGYFVRVANGRRWNNTHNADVAQMDFTNPAARNFTKMLIKKNMLALGVSGWMNDFGEEIPLDALLYNTSVSAVEYHNLMPSIWQELNREAIQEAVMEGIITQEHADNVVYFARSGNAKSPAVTRLFWLGDQLTSFDVFDGLRTALIGMITGSMSAYAFTHSDIGGYTGFGVGDLAVARSSDLMRRWSELSAFTLVFRTHPGSDPTANVQFDSDPVTAALFSRMARVHKAWAFYRRALVANASTFGDPVVRSLSYQFYHYTNNPDSALLNVDDQFMLGPDLLVAPFLDPQQQGRQVFLPRWPSAAPEPWLSLWTNQTMGTAGYVNVSFAPGCPPVFFQGIAPTGPSLQAGLLAAGLLQACE